MRFPRQPLSQLVATASRFVASLCATAVLLIVAASTRADEPASILKPVLAAQDLEVRRPQSVAATPDDQSALAPALEQLRLCREALDSVNDYTCVFTKRELHGKRLTTQTMSMKFRREPFSVYMKYDGAERGREVLFVEGRYNNKLLVHEPNVAVLGSVTIPLAINAPEVAKENRHPITNAGMHSLAQIALATWSAESQSPDVTCEEFPNAKLEGQACHAVRTTFTTPRRERKIHQVVVYFDKETRLPVRGEQYAFPRRPGEKPVLLEEYTFTRIATNVGLTDRDFDPRNRAYRFQ